MKIEIIGRIGKELEVRYTQTAVKVVSLTIAVDIIKSEKERLAARSLKDSGKNEYNDI